MQHFRRRRIEQVSERQRLAGIVTRLWVLKYGGQVQQEQEISSSPNVRTACGAHPDSFHYGKVSTA